MRPHRLKTAVSIAVACVSVLWLFLLSMMLLFIGLGLGLAFGMPHTITLPRQAGHLIIFGFGLLICLGLIYMALAFTVRCPHCAYPFLKNPKGLGPNNFTYSVDCPRARGASPWAYQIGRYLFTRRIRCIKCGKEIFDEGSQARS